jgi:hypothetical protein
LATEPLLHLKSDMQSGVISGGLNTLSRGLHCFTRWLVCAGLVHLPYLCPELYPDVKPETACLHVLPRGGGEGCPCSGCVIDRPKGFGLSLEATLAVTTGVCPLFFDLSCRE